MYTKVKKRWQVIIEDFVQIYSQNHYVLTIVFYMMNKVIYYKRSLIGKLFRGIQKIELNLATTYLEKIITAIKNQDNDAIKELFSEQAQNDAVDLDGGIEYLFSLIDGQIESWKEAGGHPEEVNDHGNKTIKYYYHFKVNTEKEQYMFTITGYTKDANNSKNIGVYSLKVYNRKVKSKVKKFTEPGIYRMEK